MTYFDFHDDQTGTLTYRKQDLWPWFQPDKDRLIDSLVYVFMKLSAKQMPCVISGLVVLFALGCDGAGNSGAPKRDIDGFTDLHLAAQAVDMEQVSDLLLHGADPNVVDINGVTPLHRAARDGHAELVAELVRYGADLDRKTSTGWTPLHLAIRAGNQEMVELLLGYGASPIVKLTEGRTPLMYAAEQGEAGIANVLMLMGPIDASGEGDLNINVTDANGNNALLMAILKGNTDLAGTLLTNGADPNASNKKKQLPLHLAIDQGDLILAGILLEGGANVLLQGPSGANAIALARSTGNEPMMQLLASYLPGANEF